MEDAFSEAADAMDSTMPVELAMIALLAAAETEDSDADAKESAELY